MANIKTVGVIGAGQMGGGIAHVCALAGYDVLLNDQVEPRRSMKASRLIHHNMVRQVRRGVIDRGRHGRPRWRGSSAAPALEAIGTVDLAIEAATESEAIRRTSSARWPRLSPSTLLASNTSSISLITRLASSTRTGPSGSSACTS